MPHWFSPTPLSRFEEALAPCPVHTIQHNPPFRASALLVIKRTPPSVPPTRAAPRPSRPRKPRRETLTRLTSVSAD